MSARRDESKYLFGAPLRSPEYTAGDVCAIDRGNMFTLGGVLPEFLDIEFSKARWFHTAFYTSSWSGWSAHLAVASNVGDVHAGARRRENSYPVTAQPRR